MAHFVMNRSLVLSLLPLIVSLSIYLLFPNIKLKPEGTASPQLESASRATMASETHGVKIDRNPSQAKLTELGVSSWPTWGCQTSKLPWTFTATETMYLLEGKVKVYVDGNEESFEIRAGDLVVFPKGMKVTWDIIEAVKKHYSLEK